MRKLTCAAGLTLAVSVPAVALAQSPTRQHAREYERAYSAVVAKFGHRAPGREIIRWGFDARHKATDGQVVASLGVLQRMLTPPVYVAPVSQVRDTGSSGGPQTPAYTGSSGATGGYSIPSSIVQCESGGNYSAVNSSSGAGGAFQILPSTWAAEGGSGLPQNASPAEQNRIAAKIYAGGAGRGQWSC